MFTRLMTVSCLFGALLGAATVASAVEVPFGYGGSLDQSRWRFDGRADYVGIDRSDYDLRCGGSDVNQYGGVVMNQPIYGNFDVSVFAYPNQWPNYSPYPNVAQRGLLSVVFGSGNYAFISHDFVNNTEGYDFTYIYNNQQVYSQFFRGPAPTGLRITRSGNQIAGYIYTGGWQFVASSYLYGAPTSAQAALRCFSSGVYGETTFSQFNVEQY